MSSPRTWMRPASGLISPRASFRIVLLPEPATPKMALVSPWRSWNEMPSSTCRSSKAMETSWNSTAIGASGWDLLVRCSAIAGGLAIALMAKQRHREPGDKEIYHDDEDRRRDHCLGGGAAYALSPTAG